MAALPFARLEEAYAREIRRLFRVFPETLTRAALRALADNPRFQRAAAEVAERMVAQVRGYNARSWREAAMKSSHSRSIYLALREELSRTSTRQAIRALIMENARLIRSIPIDLAQRVSRYSAEAFEKGLRAEQVEKDLRQRLSHLTKSKIRLISRTEVSKAESVVTQVRAEELDLHYYAWETSRDERVRKSHRNMQGVLVNWNDPPAPEALVGERSTLGRYHCGRAPQCRCAALPIVTLDEIQFPARVFTGGRIIRMSRAQFQRIAGFPKAA